MQNTKPLALDFSQKETSSQLFLHSPRFTSHAAGWRGMYLEYHHQPPYCTKPENYSLQHLIVIHIPTAPSPGGGIIDGQLVHEQVVAGDVAIFPANVSYQMWSHTDRKFIILSLEPTQFSRAVYEALDPDRVELTPLFPKPDPLIHQIGLALKTELEADGVGSRLYAETMINTLAVHLLKHYTTQNPIIRNASEGLTRAKVKLVKDYINDNLDRDLSLNELAALVQMSPTYFVSLFKQSTGFTPHQYVIYQRIERARQLLSQRELSVTDIAYQVGFANQGHFNRHFKKLTGVTPGSMRRQS